MLSLGADGMLVSRRDDAGAGIRARLPASAAGNATGAGDAAVAAIAAALAGTPKFARRRRRARRLRRGPMAWPQGDRVVGVAVLMPLAGDLSPDHAALEAEVVVTTLAPRESA